jgi:hypothetical protein
VLAGVRVTPVVCFVVTAGCLDVVRPSVVGRAVVLALRPGMFTGDDGI